MGKIWIVGLVSLMLILAVVVYYDQKYVVQNVAEYVYSSYIEDVELFPDGSSVSHFKPDQETATNVEPITADSLIDENSSDQEILVAEAIEQATTSIKGIPQYKKLDDKGIRINGHAILVDQYTGEHLKPFVYNVMVQIKCDEELNEVDGFNFCSTDAVVGRVQSSDAGTDPKTKKILGGFYEYIWRPSNADSSGFYDIEVIVTTDQLDQRGTYKSYEDTWKIQVL